MNCVRVFDGAPSLRREFERWQIVQDSTLTAQRYAIDAHRWSLAEWSVQRAHYLLPQRTGLGTHVKVNRSVPSSRKYPTRYSRRVTRGVSSVHARLIRIMNYWHIEWCERAFERRRRRRCYSFSCSTRFRSVIDTLLHEERHNTFESIINSIFFKDLMEHGLPICTPSISSPERPLVNLTRIHQYAAFKQDASLTTCTSSSGSRVRSEAQWVPSRCSNCLGYWVRARIHNRRVGRVKVKSVWSLISSERNEHQAKERERERRNNLRKCFWKRLSQRYFVHSIIVSNKSLSLIPLHSLLLYNRSAWIDKRLVRLTKCWKVQLCFSP